MPSFAQRIASHCAGRGERALSAESSALDVKSFQLVKRHDWTFSYGFWGSGSDLQVSLKIAQYALRKSPRISSWCPQRASYRNFTVESEGSWFCKHPDLDFNLSL